MVAMHYLIPPEVAGGATAEVFEVTRVVTQAAIPTDPAVPGSGSEAWTTVHFRGVNSGQEIALGLPDLATLATGVLTREDVENV